MKTNWRRLGEVLADMTSSREKLEAAASNGAQPETDGDPPVEEGGPASGSPMRAGRRKAARNGEREAAPAETGAAEVGQDASIAAVGTRPEGRSLLPTRTVGGGKCLGTAIAPGRQTPAGAVSSHLALREDHSPSSHSISDVRPSRAARQPRMQIAMATTHQMANNSTTMMVVALMLPPLDTFDEGAKLILGRRGRWRGSPNPPPV